MEALTTEMKASIHKMSSERLRGYLIKAGRDEDDVMTWARSQLMEEWALDIGKEEEFEASPASPAETDYALQKRRLEFEIRKYEQEKEREERKEEREQRSRKEEREERERERE